jgi:D-glycero-alpha-D-manno-heptose 1-phosphate guanylyltransferase
MNMDHTTVTGVILAGGQGTRLRQVVSDRPKVLAPVLGRPFILFLLDQLAEAGLRQVVVSTGYLAAMVEEAIGPTYRGMAVSFSREDAPLGTGGGLALAARRVRTPHILALNGDSYMDAHFGPYLAWFGMNRPLAALLLARVPDASRFGRVELAPDGSVKSFVEKGGDSGPGLINAGAYLLPTDLLAVLPADRMLSVEREVFPTLIGQGLWGYAHPGEFIDIGTPESYARAEAFLSARGRGRS